MTYIVSGGALLYSLTHYSAEHSFYNKMGLITPLPYITVFNNISFLLLYGQNKPLLLVRSTEYQSANILKS